MAEPTRRTVLAASGATLGLLLCGSTAGAVDRALRRTAARTAGTAGTTLEAVAVPVTAGSGYTRLTAGPGWPLAVRQDLVTAPAGRDDRRVALASFVQFTDLHVTDTESPVRFEYLHPYVGAPAFRPQETLGPVATASLVRRVNSVRTGPFTGRPFDFVVTTGDNTDNHEHIELDWFLGLLNGRELLPNSGDPDRYEGVQASGSALYWNPDRSGADAYTRKGFPRLPGLLTHAGAAFTSPGLDVPWYCTFGNHDDSIVGALPANAPLADDLYTGGYKLIGKDEADVQKIVSALKRRVLPPVSTIFSGSGTIIEVTPDRRRRPFTTGEFVRAHLSAANTGPGPAGHGFGPGNADGKDVYYTFRVAPGVTGISLDTTTDAGFADGSIGLRQYTWLESTLERNSSTYYDVSGTKVTQQVTDELFILFSHHTSDTMANLLPDSRHPLDPRLDGDAFVGLLNRFPNVLAWVNGHRHLNKITPHAGKTPSQSFWEVNTASHIDFPQHARIIELADNGDGTLSLFTTLLEAEAPYAADYGDASPPALASLYRELSYNDIHMDPARLGGTGDHNTELVLANPLA